MKNIKNIQYKYILWVGLLLILCGGYLYWNNLKAALISFNEFNKSVSKEDVINPKNGRVATRIVKVTERTLFDWLGVVGIVATPIMIYSFQVAEKEIARQRTKDEKDAADKRADDEKEIARQRDENEKEIARVNLREDALQDYIDHMSDILIDKVRRLELFPDPINKNNIDIDNPVRDIVRVRTTTILRRLEDDTKRQGRVLIFLRDTELFEFILMRAHLVEIDLRGVDLNRANLNGADLTEAKLNGAFLIDAYLNKACLTRADLTRAFLTRAFLNGAYLHSADLTRARLTNAYLNGAYLYFSYLNGADLTRAKLKGSYLSGADLTEAKLKGAYLYGADLADADLTRARLTNADLTDADLTRARLTNADLTDADLTDADLTNADFRADFMGRKVKNLTVEQIKAAKNWDKAKYDPEFRSLLGLPPEATT